MRLLDLRARPDAEFFARFKTQMRHNYAKGTLWRQCYKVRWLSPTRRAISFSEVLDRQFLDGTTLQDLVGARPHLLINASLYDNARRLVVTTLSQEEVAFDFADVGGVAGGLADHDVLSPMTFDHEDVM